MEKIISYPISIISLLLFLLTIVIFHPIQWICFNLFGYQVHKKSVDYLNFILLRIAHLLGITFQIENRELIPNGVPIIFVANHQSMYDIIGIIWFLRRFHPKFVSKIELGKGIPSISYNLNHGGSVLIDRNDPKQAIIEIKKLSEYIEKTNRSAVIFPEGTRTRTGKPKEFAKSGLKILCKHSPSAFVVPITINNSWKFFKFGFLPFGLGIRITFTIHEAISVKDSNIDELTDITEDIIIKSITT
ncbi:MAG: 1-acyl-sn-glycerol-3-phosphate acyltransferase [Flavobacteriaceae bacterium]|jgi:1-acyl-sn-glycerol-3-phosphate acyltransferase|nr:1-acyl-sn-glycerol-3-phosphate acyltransferase [Flavobacteriaceae bacterium]